MWPRPCLFAEFVILRLYERRNLHVSTYEHAQSLRSVAEKKLAILSDPRAIEI